jgi:deoxyribonuclease-4
VPVHANYAPEVTYGMSDPEQHIAEPAYDVADEYRPEPPAPPKAPAWMDGSLRIGIHTSIAGDIVQALDIAHRIGANAVQIFSSSPRMWVRPQGGSRIASADATRFIERRAALGLGPVVIHSNYLINLASPERVLRTRSMQAFHDEIVRAMSLHADFLVIHPGSTRGGDRRSGVSMIAEGLRQAVRGLRFSGNLRILLENTSGQGSSIGGYFQELQAIIEACPGIPLGVCIDVAHLFQFGHDLRTAEGLEAVMQKIETNLGLHQVYLVHANDSRTPLGSKIDRHDHIGKGKIGLEAFERIMTHPLLKGRPFILETPIEKAGDDARNVATLWKLAGFPVNPPRKKGSRVRPKKTKKSGASSRPKKKTARKQPTKSK